MPKPHSTWRFDEFTVLMMDGLTDIRNEVFDGVEITCIVILN